MANNFQNLQEFGGANINMAQDNVPDIDASDCDSIDFSLDGLISVNSGSTLVGGEYTGYTNTTNDYYLFRKAFGTLKDIIIRTITKASDNKTYIQWLNNNLTLTQYGQWENLIETGFTGSEFGFATGNGDGGKSINRLFISNAVDDVMIWNGAVSKLHASTCTSTTIDTNSTDLLLEGFELNPYGVTNKIIINGYVFNYTGISGSEFTGVTPNPLTSITNLEIKNGDGVAQIIDTRLCKEELVESYKLQFNQLGLTGNNVTCTDGSIDFLADTDFQLGQRIFVTGFTASGNNHVYTIKTITSTTITFDDNEVGQISEAAGNKITLSAGVPKGNVLRVDNGKLYVAGVTGQENTLNYSVTNDLTNFTITTDAKLTDGGYYTFFQGGSGITALWGRGNNKILVHKPDGIFSYNLNVDSSNKTYADIDVLALGYGVGAVNNNCIISYDKTIYYFNGAKELKMMEQSIYNTSSFNVDTIVDKLKNLAIVPRYLIYDNKKSRLVLSCNIDKFSNGNYNYLVSVYIKKSTQGNSYKLSLDNIPYSVSVTNVAFALPIVFITRENFTPYGLMVGMRGNSYIWGGNLTTSLNSKPYWITKEFTFNEPAKTKEFTIINLDGYIYGNTKIRVTVLYGPNGKDGIKHYVLDKNTLNENGEKIIDDVLIGDKNYNLLGNMSIFNSYELYRYGYSYYFKFPLHIDVNKSDRYKIRIETYAPTQNDLNGTWWAMNNLSTNVKLGEIDMNEIVNQNEVDGEGIGSMIIGSTNIVA